MRLIQFPFGLTENQKKWLEEQAKKDGISQGEVLRKMIEKEMKRGK